MKHPTTAWQRKFVSSYRPPPLSYRPNNPEEADRERAAKYENWLSRKVGHGEARRRIAEQQMTMGNANDTAYEAIETALVFRGFGMLVEQEHRWAYNAVEKTCGQCEGNGIQPDTINDSCALCNGAGSYEGEEAIAYQCLRWRFGYFTDGERIVHIGRARGWYAQQLKPLCIPMTLGCIPSADEADAIVAEALAENC